MALLGLDRLGIADPRGTDRKRVEVSRLGQDGGNLR
jgi:hypothetical protein